jgi:hypothetical protein
MPLLYMLTKPGYYQEEKILFAMKHKSPEMVQQAHNEVFREMLFSYIIFYLLTAFIFLFSFYYVIAFSGVYYYSSLGWISGGVISLFYYVFGLDFFIPLTAAFVKKFADLEPTYK